MIELITAEKYALEQHPLPGGVVGTYHKGRLIAQCKGEVELAPGEYRLLYLGRYEPVVAPEARGITAGLHAILPGEAWQQQADGELPEEFEVVFLGVVVRLMCDVVKGADLNEQALDHLLAVLDGQAVTEIQKVIEEVLRA